MDGYTEIDRHLTEFEGLEVVNYDPTAGLGDPATTCPRLYTVWVDQTAEPVPWTMARKLAMVAVLFVTAIGVVAWSGWAVLVGLAALAALVPGPPSADIVVDHDGFWAAFAAEPQLHEVRAIVVGPWFWEVEMDPTEFIAKLVSLADRLPNLRAIFFGDVVSEECEISWLTQGNLTPLLSAYPGLEVLVARGGEGLRFEGLAHQKLRKLVVQAGALTTQTIQDLAAASLPALEHLELWLGDPTYGFDATVDELRPLWDPRTFPKLHTLALRNAHIADGIAEALATDHAAVQRLDRLDLSLGTLSDLGAQALFNSPAILELETLDAHHHYLSDDWIAKLSSLPIAVDLGDPQGYVDPDDEDERYVAVGE